MLLGLCTIAYDHFSYCASLEKNVLNLPFFIDKKDGTILLNEINTLPGFTDISMYPMLWRESGIPCKELVTKLIRLAK